jgi:uncharacterized membrane protein (DUF106 family)
VASEQKGRSKYRADWEKSIHSGDEGPRWTAEPSKKKKEEEEEEDEEEKEEEKKKEEEEEKKKKMMMKKKKRPKTTIWRIHIHARYLWLQTHTVGVCNTYCFSTATMVERTPLNVTLYAHYLSCIYYTEVFKCSSRLLRQWPTLSV